ncbi:uncharacterized protein LOC105907132 isoform X3 [Clupea harengus]|uniref:Uncharacterized protein LOC105907132 isoform X3 n=1 Tax=Clupea harengus TaxID=7950 RepID=A0A6P8GR15_CLUHA|nr:uncharacterized protein LOC105907132 isoform X3 [Clupea harengus]
MPDSCSSWDCKNHRTSQIGRMGITFHRFPKDPTRRLQWCAAMGRRSSDHRLWSPSINSVLCSKHFTPDMLDCTGQTIRLRNNAIPTLFDAQKMRRKRLQEAKKKSKVSQTVSDVIEAQKRQIGRRRRGRDRNQSTEDAAEITESPPGLGDLALAAELMELVSSTVTQLQRNVQLSRALHNDHSSLPIPSDPARLCALVHGLAKDKHRQEEALLSLRKNLMVKEQQLQKNKVEWEAEQPAQEVKIAALARQLQKEHQENVLLRRQLREATEQLQSSTDAVLLLSSSMRKQKRPQAKRPAAALSARALSRGHPRWLRFYTGFRSYARFQAFLAFLQSADGTMLAQSCLSEAEEGVEEEDEEEEETEEKRMSDKDVIHQDSTPPPQHNNHALFPDDDEEEEDEEQEATGESVRRRLLAQLRVTSRPASVHRVLGPEDQLLLVLTRLRLGLLLHDLAFRFHVAEATASRVWGHWLGLMQRRLQQVPVRCSQHYISQFKPQHSLSLGPGHQLAVLECSDLLFDALFRDRQRVARGTIPPRRAVASKTPLHSPQPYRHLWPQRGCALASPEGHLGFCSSSRLQEWEDWAAKPDGPVPAALPTLPAYLVGNERGVVPVPAEGVPCLEVLSVRSLTDKALTFRYLRTVHTQTQGSVIQMDRAWEVCCYLACLLHQPMGLR